MVVSVYGSHHYKNILHQQWQRCKYAGCPLLTHSANKRRPAPLERGRCAMHNVHPNTYIIQIYPPSQHIYSINISTMPCNALLSVLLFSGPFIYVSVPCDEWKLLLKALYLPADMSQFMEAALYFAKYLLCGCDHYKLFICFARPAISVWGVSSLCDTRPRPSQFILKS